MLAIREKAMADPYVVDDAQAQWGLKPDAPPAPAPQPGAPQPAPQPVPLNYSERQKWGTQPLPGGTRGGATDPDTGQRYEVPHALDTAPPPVPPGPPVQSAVDDAREWDRSKEDEITAFSKGPPLSVTDYKPVPETYSEQQHPMYERYTNAQGMVSQLTDKRERAEGDKMVKQMGDRIKADTAAKNRQATAAHREQMARDDAPYQTVEARDKTVGAMTTHVTNVLNDTFGRSQSNDPTEQRQASFDMSASPIITMSRPKPGTNEKDPPSAENRDYSTLVAAASDLAVHNRKFVNNADAVRAIIRMGTFGGGTGKDADQPGFNGRKGMGAANYKVIGRDVSDNFLVEMNNGVRLRVPPDTMRLIVNSRQQSAQRARQWQTDYDKSQQSSLFRQGLNEVLKLIPEKGF